MAYPEPAAGEAEPLRFLRDLAGRQELRSARRPGLVRPALPPDEDGFWPHGSQLFLQALADPASPYRRLLLNWQVGTGKTLAAVLVARRFARHNPEKKVFVLGFTRAVFQAELLRRPELGFVSHAELAELLRLRGLAGLDAVAAQRYRWRLAVLRRRLTNPRSGGYFRFLGYREFANRLYGVEAAGRLAAGERAAAALPPADPGLLEELRGGLLIADEVHNTYNQREPNSYGVALQQALDQADPRALLLSATPLTGSATEVVSLLRLLGAKVRREELFRPGTAELLGGAEERIAQLALGRVSFLAPDGGQGALYPRRVLEGEALPGVPFLRFTLCEPSPGHREALRAAGEAEAEAPASLPDMIFPGRGEEEEADPGRALKAAELAGAAGPARVERVEGRPPVLGGPFLRLPGLARWSGKYARLLQDLVEGLGGGGVDGKALVFHPRVQGSGAYLIGEALRANGFVLPGETAAAATLCARCGRPLRAHRRDKRGGGPQRAHEYAPARYAVVTGDQPRREIEVALRRYNSPENRGGLLLRVLVGSRIIMEGLDFRAVRLLAVAAAPNHIPLLLQVYGRAVRRGSHAGLPAPQQEVRVRTYVTRHGPEAARYRRKWEAYACILRAERALRRYAVDGFLSCPRPPSLESAGETPPLSAAAFRELPGRRATYYAYGHAREEVAEQARLVRLLLRRQPVWARGELWAALQRVGPRAEYDEENFVLALAAQGVRLLPAAADECYVLAGGGGALDVESYLRPEPGPGLVRVGLGADTDRAKEARCAERLGGLRAEALGPAFLVQHPAAFHRWLLRRLVRPGGERPEQKGLLRAAALLYRRFGILLRPQDLPRAALQPLLGGFLPETGPPMAYADWDSLFVFRAGHGWQELPRSALGREEPEENNILVGFSEERRGRVVFKVRPPLQQLRAAARGSRDRRKTARGAVCASRPRVEQSCLACRLDICGKGSCARLGAKMLCRMIRDRLLGLEEEARAAGSLGRRWFYLFSDPRPAIE